MDIVFQQPDLVAEDMGGFDQLEISGVLTLLGKSKVVLQGAFLGLQAVIVQAARLAAFLSGFLERLPAGGAGFLGIAFLAAFGDIQRNQVFLAQPAHFGDVFLEILEITVAFQAAFMATAQRA